MHHGGKWWELFLQSHGSPSSRYPSVLDVSPSWSRITAPAAVPPPSIPCHGDNLGAPFSGLLFQRLSFPPSLAVAALQREHEHPHQVPLAVPVAVINSSRCLGGCRSSPELWPIHNASTLCAGCSCVDADACSCSGWVPLPGHCLVPVN